ncbi:hypothetical protein BaRGS_00018608 [Batillaria attramentaria]|uniref:Uncharacterized protein n=1 Tax=Batillaria attramentaria TaxID=370345 RepID=A0ABD0KSQ6_9CAEN
MRSCCDWNEDETAVKTDKLRGNTPGFDSNLSLHKMVQHRTVAAFVSPQHKVLLLGSVTRSVPGQHKHKTKQEKRGLTTSLVFSYAVQSYTKETLYCRADTEKRKSVIRVYRSAHNIVGVNGDEQGR